MSKISRQSCELKRLPDLPFELSYASCGSYFMPLVNDEVNQNIALLCFSSTDALGICRTWDGNKFGKLEETTSFLHSFSSRTLGVYHGYPFTVGGMLDFSVAVSGYHSLLIFIRLRHFEFI